MSFLNPLPGKAQKSRVPKKKLSELLPAEKARFQQARFLRAEWAYAARRKKLQLLKIKKLLGKPIFHLKNKQYKNAKKTLQQIINGENVSERQFRKAFGIVEGMRQEIKQTWRTLGLMHRTTLRLRTSVPDGRNGVIPSEIVTLERELKAQESKIDQLREKNDELKKFLESARETFHLMQAIRRARPKS